MPVSPGELSSPEHVVFVASAGAFAVGELVQAVRLRRRANRVDIRAEALFRLMFLTAVLMWPLGPAVVPGARFGGGAYVFTLGAITAWAGALLRWWSIVTLGRYFTVVVMTAADQPVIDRGPYRVLRHPAYTGLLLVVGGLGVMTGNAAGAAAALVLVLVAVIHRLRVEERALVAALGDRYRAFAASRARLIPFVW